MWKPPLKTGTLIVLSSILALGSVACSLLPGGSSDESTTATAPASPSPAASPSPQPTTSAALPSPKPSALQVNQATTTTKTIANKASTTAKNSGNKTSTTAKNSANKTLTTSINYQQAIDIASGAITISKSAVSRDDWSLVASQWQQAINLLKGVSPSSRQHTSAQKKLPQYQRFLADAKLRARPAPKKPKLGDTNPQFFSVPIKGRTGGIPIVEVSFNSTRKFEMLFDTGATSTLITQAMALALGLKAVGSAKIAIADGSVVELYVTQLKSMEIDGRLKRNVLVAVAPPAMPIGLLGQDFFEGYDVAIKENAIEFRRR